jgi:hypothetical protein
MQRQQDWVVPTSSPSLARTLKVEERVGAAQQVVEADPSTAGLQRGMGKVN